MSTTVYSRRGEQLKLSSADDVDRYVREIIASSSLSKIDFSGNTIGVDASEALAAALLHHKDTLTEIDFSDMYTGRLNTEIPQSLSHLLPALLECPNLKTINLSDNAFGLQTIVPIEDYLRRAVSLEHIILSNNGMGPNAGSRIGESLFYLALAKKAKNLPSLKTFVCGRNRLENGLVNHLAVAFRNHPDLEKVRLYQNGIRPAGIAKLISQGLSHNRKLQVLDLQDNTLTVAGGKEVARALSNWEHLVELNLNDALLKRDGSFSVILLLKQGHQSKLEILRLQYNELEEPSLAELAAALAEKKLPALRSVELNGNRFDQDSATIAQISESCELDELDELEELDSEDEDDDDEEGDALENDIDLDALEKTLRAKDTSVDDLAAELAGTRLK